MKNLAIIFLIIFGFNSYAVSIYVDNLIVTDITNGTYSVGNRDNSGADGNAYITVQNGINAALPGDTIFVREGTYNETGILFNVSGNKHQYITIKNFPEETPIIDGGYSTAAGHHPVFEIQNVKFINIDGLTIKHGSQSNIFIGYHDPASNIVIQNCDISEFWVDDNSANVYVHANSNDSIYIFNNHLHHALAGPSGLSNSAGIILFRCKTVFILNNEIHDTQHGIYYKHSDDDGNITYIQNNLIYNCHNTSYEAYGMIISRADCIIKNNVIRSSDYGIRIFAQSATCDALCSKRNKIIHNSIIDCRIGIFLEKTAPCDGAKYTTVKDNLLFNFTEGDLRGLAIYPYQTVDSSYTTVEYNLIYSSLFPEPVRCTYGNYYSVASPPPSFLGNSSTSIQLAPVFVNYSTKDFNLTALSPGKNAASDNLDMGALISEVGIKPHSNILGLNNITPEIDVNVYPNPANKYINIVLSNSYKDSYILIYDISGKTVLKQKANFSSSNFYTLNIEDIQKGFYFVKVISGNQSICKKLIIN